MKFELYYPVKPLGVNQIFGNPDPKYFTLGLAGHNGIDFRAYHGQPVYASHDGTGYQQTDMNQGHGVVIVTDQPFDYNGGQVYFASIYWHLIDNIPVKNGDKIKAGDFIGFSDSTGFSTGDHLHFGLKPKILGQAPNAGDAPDIGIGNLVNLEQNNGYLGAINPQSYFNNKFAQDLNQSIIRVVWDTLVKKGLTGYFVQFLKNFLNVNKGA